MQPFLFIVQDDFYLFIFFGTFGNYVLLHREILSTKEKKNLTLKMMPPLIEKLHPKLNGLSKD